MSYKKSSVTGRTWSTPFNTPFFVRWGEWNVKVPMERLREEYNAWEQLQPHPEPEFPKCDTEAPGAGRFASFPSDRFDWAEDVEQELFSASGSNFDNSTGSPDDNRDIGRVDSPIVGVPEEVVVIGAAGTTALCAILEEDEEEGVAGEDKSGNPNSSTSTTATTVTTATTATSSTDADNTVYRIANVSAVSDDLSIHMVEDASTADIDDPTTTAQKLSEAIQFLAGVGPLNLDTYATVFETAARACTSGDRFWLNDPACGYEIVV